MKLYGEDKQNSEIKEFITEYVDSALKNKNNRYHDILSLFPNSNLRVLDYGCGWGYYSIALQEKGFYVTATDISKNEVDICNFVWGKIDNIIFENKSITDYENEEFDYVLSSEVIEHVHNTGNYLSNINRVLKVGGCLIISLPNVMNFRFFFGMLSKNLKEKLKKISKDTLDNYDKTQDHIHAWDPTHFVRLVSSVGFVLEEYIPMGGIAFPFRKPFAPYVHLRNTRVRNLSYQMAFKFRKVKNIEVRIEE
jgi:2-polyprenyl-3-methyl-5-hydroxy-6-metoxy-1,4-benzoquinol methylase